MIETNGGRHTAIAADFMGIDPDALLRLARIIHEGAVSHDDPDGSNWRRIPCDVHLNHALAHVNAYGRGDVTEDHLGHALARMVFACATEGGAGSWK